MSFDGIIITVTSLFSLIKKYSRRRDSSSSRAAAVNFFDIIVNYKQRISDLLWKIPLQRIIPFGHRSSYWTTARDPLENVPFRQPIIAPQIAASKIIIAVGEYLGDRGKSSVKISLWQKKERLTIFHYVMPSENLIVFQMCTNGLNLTICWEANSKHTPDNFYH